jgi:anti-anti-sigma factor
MGSVSFPLGHQGFSCDPSLYEPTFQMRTERIASDVCTIAIVGALDMSTAPLLGAALALRREPSDAHVQVELSQVVFLDTVGLDALNEVVTDLEFAGAQVTVVGARPQVRKLLAFAAEHDWRTSAPILAAATPP